MSKKFKFFIILVFTMFCISSGCAELTEKSPVDKNVENRTMDLNESIEHLENEIGNNSNIYEVSLYDLEGYKVLVVTIADPNEADNLFDYSSKMCDRYLNGYGIDNVTLDVRLANGEQLAFGVHQFDS